MPARYLADMKSRARRRLQLAWSLTVLLSGNMAAQATLHVGPGGYPEITDAIAAAQAGDLIVVEPGTYLPFDLPIGLRIVAPSGATVTTPPGGGGMPGIYYIQPPPGEQATISGFTFRQNPAYPPPEPSVSLRANGCIVFSDCLFHNWADWGDLSVVCNGDVQFDRCEWNCLWDCMSVTGGNVVANHCKFRAYRNDTYGGWLTTCIVASGGSIRLNFCDLHGSDGGAQSSVGSPAIRLNGSAQLSVADSTITGGTSMSWPSTAIDNDSSSPVMFARSTIQGGTGLLVFQPPVFGPGPGIDGPSQFAPLLGGIAIPTGPRIGAVYAGTALVPTNSIVLVVLSWERTAAVTVPFAAAPLHFDPTSAIIYSWGLPGATPWPDTGAFAWQTPVLTQNLFGSQFWLHALAWDGTTFLVGPTFGGLVY